MELSRIYARRFTSQDRRDKARAWRVLCDIVFSSLVRPDDSVVDLGAGYCEFVNAITARRRIAVDANPDTARFAAPGVEVRAGPADLSFLAEGEVDVVFSSNFLEHLPDKDAVARVVAGAWRALKPGGLIVLMGPNVRLVPGRYWDFYDHHVPLSDRSVCELLEIAGFEIRSTAARFVPYSVLHWRLPRYAWLVRAYLALRPISSAVFGQQFLVVAAKAS